MNSSYLPSSFTSDQLNLATRKPRKNRAKRGLLRSAPAVHAKTADATLPPNYNTFANAMDELLPLSNQRTEQLNVLWKKLPTIERNLIDLPNRQNLYSYKELVIHIAKLTLKNNSLVHSLSSTNKLNGETKVLDVLQCVDAGIQKMLEIMFSSQNPAFQLLNSMDDIRGMLLDLRS